MEFFTLEMLGTTAGIVTVVTLMVQVCKNLFPFKLDPKIYCVFWAAIFTLAKIVWLTPVVLPADYFAAAINVLLITVAATGTFEYVIKPIQNTITKAKEAKAQDDSETGDI